MDTNRFDALALAFAARVTRRVPLQLLSALALGGLAVASDDAAAKKRKKKCKGDKKKCGKRCIPNSECCGGCGNLTCCNGACVDLATDGANCGACGVACATASCANGACRCSTGEDCPGGCACALASPGSPGGRFCSAGATTTSCDEAADCGFRAFCRQTGDGNVCGEPCLA